MDVPPGAVDEIQVVGDLDEAHAALDEPPRDEAARAELRRGGFINAIQLLRRRAFAGDVHRFLRGGLHLRGEFVAGDAGGELLVARKERATLDERPGALGVAAGVREGAELDPGGLGGLREDDRGSAVLDELDERVRPQRRQSCQ